MSVKFNSSGGGSVTLDAPSTASNLTVTLPSASGTLATTSGSDTTFTSITDSGNLTFTGTGNRITGDFSNATLSNRVLFQTTTSNSNTALGAVPSGTGTASILSLYGSSDPANSSIFELRMATSVSEARISSTIAGTGTYMPMTFYTNGSEQMRLTSTGLGIGTSSPAFSLETVSGVGLSTSGTGVLATFGANNTTDKYVRIRNSNGHFEIGTISTAHYMYGNGSIPLVFYTNTSERMRINAGAPILCLSGGNTSATGTGIAFPATQSASSDANTLDDYEEGTFTPGLAFGGSSTGITYNTAAGFYVKIGRMVFVRFGIYLSSKGSSTGTATVTGLPFTNTSQSYSDSSIVFNGYTFASVSYSITGIVQNNTTNVVLATGGTTGIVGLTNTNFQNTTEFYGSTCYLATA